MNLTKGALLTNIIVFVAIIGACYYFFIFRSASNLRTYTSEGGAYSFTYPGNADIKKNGSVINEVAAELRGNIDTMFSVTEAPNSPTLCTANPYAAIAKATDKVNLAEESVVKNGTLYKHLIYKEQTLTEEKYYAVKDKTCYIVTLHNMQSDPETQDQLNLMFDSLKFSN